MAEDEKVVKLKILTEADSKALVEMTNALRDVAKASGNLSTDSTRDLKNFASQVESVFKTAQAATRIKPELDTSALFQQAAKVRDEFGKVIDGLGDTTKELTQQFKLQAQQMTASMSVARAGVDIQKEMAKASLDLAKAEQMRIDNLTRDERNRLALRERETKAAHDSEMRAAREMEALDKAIHTERMRQIREADAAAASASRRRIEEERQTQVAARSQQRGGGGGGGIGLGINIGIGTQLVGAFTSAVSESIGIIDRYSTTLQSAQVQFTGMMGSADAARAHLQDLSEFAAKTPFDIPTVVESSRMLQAYGFAAADVIPSLTTLGNLAGASGERFSRLAYAYSEVYEKQRLYSQDLRQFETAGIPILQTLAKAYGATAQEVKKMVEEGRIGFPHVQWALQELEKTKFADQLIKQSQLLKGELSNLRDRIGILGDKMFEPIAGAAAKMVRDVSGSLTGKDLEKAAEDLGNNIVSGANAAIDALRPLATAVKRLIDDFGGFQGAIEAAQGAMSGFSPGTVISTITGILNAIHDLKTTFDGLPDPVKAMLGNAFSGAVTTALPSAAIPRSLGAIGQIGAVLKQYYTTPPPAVTARELWLEGQKDRPEPFPGAPSAADIEAATRAAAEEADANRDLADAAGAVTDAYRKLHDEQRKAPPPDAPKAHTGAAKELKKTLEELIAEYYALQAAMEAIKATVASGDLLGAARQLVALGKSNEQAVSEVLSIQKDLAREAEQRLKDAADAAKEARSAFLDLADTLLGQVTKAFEALSGASSTSAQSVVNAITAMVNQAGGLIGKGLNIPIASTIFKPGHPPAYVGGVPVTGGGGGGGPYEGIPGMPEDYYRVPHHPGDVRTTRSQMDQGFSDAMQKAIERFAIGAGVAPWRQGQPGVGLIPSISGGFAQAAEMAKAEASLEGIEAQIKQAETAIAEFGDWVGRNLTGPAKEAAGSTVEFIDALARMAREANGDADKLSILAKMAEMAGVELKKAGELAVKAEEAKKADLAAQRAEAVKAGEFITQANQIRMGITTPRGPGGFQGTAPGGRDEYGNFFTPGVQSVWMGKNWEMKFATAEEQYQSWFKAKFDKTRSEMDLENAYQPLIQDTERLRKEFQLLTDQMARRARQADYYAQDYAFRVQSTLGVAKELFMVADQPYALSELTPTMQALVRWLHTSMERGIKAIIDPNQAADHIGAALDRKSSLLSGAGGFGPGVF